MRTKMFRSRKNQGGKKELYMGRHGQPTDQGSWEMRFLCNSTDSTTSAAVQQQQWLHQ